MGEFKMGIYNLKRDIEDPRDFQITKAVMPVLGVKLPNKVDLRSLMPPVFNQSSLGSCSSNAGVANMMYLRNHPEELSRLFLYYKEREIEGTINEDAGAQMRDICKALYNFGVCTEQYMPYNIDKFTVTPSQEAINDALNHKVTAYHSLKTIADIKNNLALRQRPALMGMMVYESFESEAVAKTGKVPIPNSKNLGGHAVLIVGYQDASTLQKLMSPITGKSVGYFIVRNSWGPEWGDKGYFYLPYEFIVKGFAFDFWSLDN
jgi:C1A family cysteine protease